MFVDGGVAAAIKPALHTLMLASLDGHGLRWPLGAEKRLLVSAGTGEPVFKMTADEAMGVPASMTAINALFARLYDTDWLVQTVLQWMSDSPTRWHIDAEIGDLSKDRLADRPLFTYLRYNTLLEAGWLQEQLGLDITEEEAAALVPMDHAKAVELLAEIGRRAAAKQVREDHFPASFDLPAS